MMGWSPQCYISSFVEISKPVLEKIFEGFLPYMGVVAIRFSNSLYLKAFIQILVQMGTVVSEKIQFYLTFIYVHDLGPRSRNDLDLKYSLTFINSKRGLLLPNFRSLAAIVSEKSTVFTFSYRKA